MTFSVEFSAEAEEELAVGAVRFDEQRPGLGSEEPGSDWEQPLAPGGENNKQFLARISGVLEELSRRHQGETVWVICHGGVIMATAVLLMQAPRSMGGSRWENPRPTAISEWWRVSTSRLDERWTLRRYNDFTHLLHAL